MTGFTGAGFVGFIGISTPPPPEGLYVTGFATSTPIVTLGAPAGITDGDLMLACVSAGSYGPDTSGPYTLTVPSGWTPVLVDPSDGAANEIIANLYSRIADADDEAGTSSYTWSVAVPASLPGIAVAHVGWPRKHGRTVGATSIDYSLSPSVPSPGGRWQFAFITQRTASSFGQPVPDPVLSTPATELAPIFGAARPGAMRAYASHKQSPIVGAYLNAGVGSPRQALVVAAISA